MQFCDSLTKEIPTTIFCKRRMLRIFMNKWATLLCSSNQTVCYEVDELTRYYNLPICCHLLQLIVTRTDQEYIVITNKYKTFKGDALTYNAPSLMHITNSSPQPAIMLILHITGTQ